MDDDGKDNDNFPAALPLPKITVHQTNDDYKPLLKDKSRKLSDDDDNWSDKNNGTDEEYALNREEFSENEFVGLDDQDYKKGSPLKNDENIFQINTTTDANDDMEGMKAGSGESDYLQPNNQQNP